MRYTTEIEISAPLEKVADLIGDHNHLKKWVKELDRYETIEGKPKEKGAVTLLTLNVAGGIKVTETILEVNFPKAFVTHYKMPGGSFKAKSQLHPIGKDETRFILDHEFEFEGPLKTITSLMEPAFIRYSEQMMNNFKALVEGHTLQ